MARVTYVTVKVRKVDATEKEAHDIAQAMTAAAAEKRARHVETTIKEDLK